MHRDYLQSVQWDLGKRNYSRKISRVRDVSNIKNVEDEISKFEDNTKCLFQKISKNFESNHNIVYPILNNKKWRKLAIINSTISMIQTIKSSDGNQSEIRKRFQFCNLNNAVYLYQINFNLLNFI